MKNLLFVGDLILGDQPVKFGYGFDSIHKSEEYKGIFDGVIETLKDSVCVVGNFESVIKKRNINTQDVSSWSMCCDQRICKELYNANIRIISLANNHTMDYGEEWFNFTKEQLSRAGIKIIGLNSRPYEVIFYNNKRIVLIGVSYLKTKHKNPLYFYRPSREEWEKVLSEIGDVDFKIVYVHWGNEFISNPSHSQYEIAQDLIDLGFDLIVGHHPHIIQQPCLIKSKPVYFSLGNFLSDYWQKRLRKSIILGLDLDNLKQLREYLCCINSKGIPQFQSDNLVKLKKFKGSTSSNWLIYKERMRIRFEYLFHILKNCYKISGKLVFLGWFLRRFMYVFFNLLVEVKNPDVIYEKYKH